MGFGGQQYYCLVTLLFLARSLVVVELHGMPCPRLSSWASSVLVLEEFLVADFLRDRDRQRQTDGQSFAAVSLLFVALFWWVNAAAAAAASYVWGDASLRLAALGVAVKGLCNAKNCLWRERDREANKSLTASSSLKEIFVLSGGGAMYSWCSFLELLWRRESSPVRKEEIGAVTNEHQLLHKRRRSR
jgi:hypothetical protein